MYADILRWYLVLLFDNTNFINTTVYETSSTLKRPTQLEIKTKTILSRTDTRVWDSGRQQEVPTRRSDQFLLSLMTPLFANADMSFCSYDDRIWRWTISASIARQRINVYHLYAVTTYTYSPALFREKWKRKFVKLEPNQKNSNSEMYNNVVAGYFRGHKWVSE